jgi:hypothetical protein
MNSDYPSLTKAYPCQNGDEENNNNIREDFPGVKPSSIIGRKISTSSLVGDFSGRSQHRRNYDYHNNYERRHYRRRHDYPYLGFGSYNMGYPYLPIVGYQYPQPQPAPIYLQPSNFTFFDALEYNLSFYPLNPSDKDIKGMVDFIIYRLPYIIPCSTSCKNEVIYFTDAFLKNYNNDPYQLCKDKTALVSFFKDFKIYFDSKFGAEIRTMNYTL